MTRYLLSLGSNQGDRREEMALATAYVAQLGSVVAASPTVETAAWGLSEAALPVDARTYCNCLLDVESELLPWRLHALLVAHEDARGRERGRRNAARRIDIDILAAQRTTMHAASLHLPHPRLFGRDYLRALLSSLPTRQDWEAQLRAAGLAP